MDEELKKLLQENIELAKKNQEVMSKILWNQKLMLVWGVLKWTVIIGTTIGAFYLLKPMLDNLMGVYANILGSDMKNSLDLKSILGQ